MTLIGDDETTEVWKGMEDIVSRSMAVMDKISSTFDLCTDPSGPISVLSFPEIRNRYYALKARGVKIRMITVINHDNIPHVKEFAKIAEIRHLDDVAGNFTLADNTDYAGSPEAENDGALTKLVVSNVGSFVRLQQYFFETLWNKAIPATEKIDELEKGIYSQVTEVGYGAEKAISVAKRFLSEAKKTVDMCGDAKGPGFILAAPIVHSTFLDANRRCVKIRMIVEVTKEHLAECKKMFEFAEVRHLEGIKGYSTILDSQVFASNTGGDGPLIPHVVYSTVRVLVEQQQYFFNTLWEKAIPAGQRIKEIEEGKTPSKIELIYDIENSMARAFEVMAKTKKELVVLFATSRTFRLALSMNVADTYRKMSEQGVKIRILVPGDNPLENELRKARETAPLVEIKSSDEALNTHITILVSDRKEFMSWELKDDTTADPYVAGGVATYSNFDTLAGSYSTIFENLWTSTEIAENLKIANIRLESKEAAMKEFIDIAAHELRTPIQPILGLAENLKDILPDSTEEQKEMLEVIIRNAKRLQRLQQDILDVTRIEGRMLKLHKQKLNLSTTISELLQDFSDEIDEKDLRLSISCDPSLIILADKDRISQVLSNLLSNAIKATVQRDRQSDSFANKKEKSVSVAVYKDNEVRSSGTIISVKDNGLGIDPEIEPKLFTKFATKSESGTGLGLYIAKGIVEAHGGRIWAENNKEGGATFCVYIPTGG